MGSLESGSLALFSGIIELLEGSVASGCECISLGLGLGELELGWGAVVPGPVYSLVVECLLCLNALLGLEGGGEDGSSSSGGDGITSGVSSCGITELLGGNDSGLLGVLGVLELISGINLSSGKWSNLQDEIAEKGTGSGKIGGSSRGLLGSSSLPAGDGLLLTGGGGEKGDLASLSGFSSTDGSGLPCAGGDFVGLAGLLTSEYPVGVEGFIHPVVEPEEDLGLGSGDLLSCGDGGITGAVVVSELGGGPECLGLGHELNIGAGGSITLEEWMESVSAVVAIAVVEVAPGGGIAVLEDGVGAAGESRVAS